MPVKGGVQNGERAIKRLEMLGKGVVSTVNGVLAKNIVKIDEEIKNKIQKGGRTGRKYRRRSVTHQASSKDEFPKTDTGALVSGFVFKTPKKTGRILKAELSNKAEHAKYLEFKPKSAGGRPFMRPTFKKWTPIIRKELDKEVKKTIKVISKS